MHNLEDCPAFLLSAVVLTVPPCGDHHQKWWEKWNYSQRIRRPCKRFFFVSSADNFHRWAWWPGYIFTQCPGFTLLLHGNTEHSTLGRGLFTTAIAWSSPSRFFIAMPLLPYLAFSLITFPSAPPLRVMPQHWPHSPHLRGHPACS